MSYLFSFSGYQTKCVIEFLFRQLITSWTLRFIFDHPPKQGRQVEKEERTEIQKFEYVENEKSFLDEIKSIFHGFLRAIIWWNNKNLMKIADTGFKEKTCLEATCYTATTTKNINHRGHPLSKYAQNSQKLDPLPPCTQSCAFGLTPLYAYVHSIYSLPPTFSLLMNFYSDSSFRHPQFRGYFHF